MIYRPNFCCSCGEKIERVSWPLLASRRFCDVCHTENQLYDWLPRIIVMLGLILGAAGLVSFYKPIQRVENTASRTFAATISQKPKPSASEIDTTPAPIQQSQTGSIPNIPTQQANSAPIASKPAPAVKETDAVYYCGAMTKKGTPCTRRVKRRGERCWQHQGLPAMAEIPQK